MCLLTFLNRGYCTCTHWRLRQIFRPSGGLCYWHVHQERSWSRLVNKWGPKYLFGTRIIDSKLAWFLLFANPSGTFEVTLTKSFILDQKCGASWRGYTFIFSSWGISLHNVWIYNADHPYFSKHRLQRAELGCLVEISCNFTWTTGGHFFWNTIFFFEVTVEGLPSMMHSSVRYVSLEWIFFLNGYQCTTSLDFHSRKNRCSIFGARFRLINIVGFTNLSPTTCVHICN